VAEAAAPTQYSDDYILSKVRYDAAGRVYKQFDNLGRKTVTLYDLLGRTGKVIENYVNGLVGETETDTDRTTMYIYDSAGRLWQQVAVNPKGDDNDPNNVNVENQVTYYLYESPISGAWVTSVIYPDSPDTTSAGADQVKFTYDRLGRKTSSTDQRGVVHEYSFDPAGRLEADSATSLGAAGQGVKC
jgi:YD repeat-containing protein